MQVGSSLTLIFFIVILGQIASFTGNDFTFGVILFFILWITGALLGYIIGRIESKSFSNKNIVTLTSIVILSTFIVVSYHALANSFHGGGDSLITISDIILWFYLSYVLFGFIYFFVYLFNVRTDSQINKYNKS